METRSRRKDPFFIRRKTPCFTGLGGKPVRKGRRILPTYLYGWQIWIKSLQRRACHAFGLRDAAVILRHCDLLLHDVECGSPRHHDERRIDRLTGLTEITGQTINENARRNIDCFNGSNDINVDAEAKPDETASTTATVSYTHL